MCLCVLIYETYYNLMVRKCSGYTGNTKVHKLYCILNSLVSCILYRENRKCNDLSKLFRSNNSYSNISMITAFYVIITKAIMSSSFQFRSQWPFICITETNDEKISASVWFIMTVVQVFLMIHSEVEASMK